MFSARRNLKTTCTCERERTHTLSLPLFYLHYSHRHLVFRMDAEPAVFLPERGGVDSRCTLGEVRNPD